MTENSSEPKKKKSRRPAAMVFTAQKIIDVDVVRAYLQSNGIEVYLNGENLIGIMGEVSFTEWPELWVKNPEQVEEARNLVAKFEAALDQPAPVQEDWTCACGEEHEAQFSTCWKCNADRKL